jgi:hypothetical protein
VGQRVSIVVEQTDNRISAAKSMGLFGDSHLASSHPLVDHDSSVGPQNVDPVILDGGKTSDDLERSLNKFTSIEVERVRSEEASTIS